MKRGKKKEEKEKFKRIRCFFFFFFFFLRDVRRKRPAPGDSDPFESERKGDKSFLVGGPLECVSKIDACSERVTLRKNRKTRGEP